MTMYYEYDFGKRCLECSNVQQRLRSLVLEGRSGLQLSRSGPDVSQTSRHRMVGGRAALTSSETAAKIGGKSILLIEAACVAETLCHDCSSAIPSNATIETRPITESYHVNRIDAQLCPVSAHLCLPLRERIPEPSQHPEVCNFEYNPFLKSNAYLLVAGWRLLQSSPNAIFPSCPKLCGLRKEQEDYSYMKSTEQAAHIC